MRPIPTFLVLSVLATAATASPAFAAEPMTLQSRTVVCESKGNERQHCAADTSRGVALVRTLSDEAPCLLGKTWGYDDAGIWVTDGCSAEFLPGQELPTKAEPLTAETPKPETPPKTEEEKKKFLEHVPNLGFRIYEGKEGQIYFRILAYVRYLNQKGLDPSYTDYFGATHSVKQRQDIEVNKVFFPFYGWFLTPKFTYYLWAWTNNAIMGQGGSVILGGHVDYHWNKQFNLGLGINALPTTRSTEGQFPYWLGVDDRLTSDEFFRGSYTTGAYLYGEAVEGVNYKVMVGNNLNQVGVNSARLDNGMSTQSFMINWMPTTKEFGYFGGYGDYEEHQKVATRVGAHFTHSREDKESQPGEDGIENTQVRLTDGSIVFTPDLFAPGVAVRRVTYEMASADFGVKYKGFSLEGEYFWRWLSNFTGTNTQGIADIKDHGYQIQSSAMVIPKTLQVYLSGAEILGRYGDGSEVRAGLNWWFEKTRGLRFNAEWLHLKHSPVGYTAVPYPVGGNGDVFHTNLEMNF